MSLKYHSMMLAAVAILFLIVVVTAAQANYPKQALPNQDARTKFLETLKIVQAADFAGATNAELSSSVDKMNQALQLIESANLLEKRGQLSDANKAAQEALQILSSLQPRVLDIQEKAQTRSQQQRILTYVMAPVMAFLTVLAYHYGREAHRRYRVTKTMNMRVVVKPNAGKE